MPDVIAEIDGWTKVFYLNDHDHARGQFTVAVRRPMAAMVVPEDYRPEPRPIEMATARFFRTRRYINGMAVYREEHTP